MGIAKEKAFPRGGAPPKKAPAQGQTIQKDKDLFSTQVNVSTKKKKKNKKSSKVEEISDVLKLTTVEPLTYDKLSEGLQILARISEIRDLELKLSLPGRLVALVPITKISNAYTEGLKKVANDPSQAETLNLRPLSEIFQVGQLVCCTIAKVEKAENDFYNVIASLMPKNTNYGKNHIVYAAVKSIEDHGYVMDIGSKTNLKAFLPLKRAQELSIGQVIACTVTKNDGNALVLHQTTSKHLISNVQELNIHQMYPGMNIKCQVESNLKHGLMLKLGDFHGYVNVNHVNEDLEIGHEVQARILYVLPTINQIHFGLHELDFDANIENVSEKSVKVGELVKNSLVIEADQRGFVVKLNDEGCSGVVPIRHMNDTKDIKAKLNTKVNVRVLQYDYFEEIFVCSMQKSLLEQNIFKLEHLKPGQILGNCKAKKWAANGLIVEVGRNLDGFVPNEHLSDVPLKNPQKKFSLGDKMKVRVLKLDPSKKKLHLTAKKLLLKEDFEIVDDFDDKYLNTVTEGTVVKVTQEGLLMTLFGDVCGFVPKSKVSKEEIQDLEKIFYNGQVLKCKVLEINAARRKMVLTLILSEFKPLGQKEKKAHENIKKGQFYENVKVCDITPDGLAVEIADGIKAVIPLNHLTDHIAIADLVLNSFKKDDIIEKALCFEKDVFPILTLKPSILNYSGLNETFEDLHEGQTVPCVVSNIKPYGVFVKLPMKVRKAALIPLRHLAEAFVEDPADLYQMHQTIFGKILEKDDKEQKITMTSKFGQIREASDYQKEVDLAIDLMSDLAKVRNRCENPELALINIGDVVNVTVQDVSEFGVDTIIEGTNIRGLVPKSTLSGLDLPEKGQTVAGVVVFVDYRFNAAELSFQPEIIKNSMKKGKKRPCQGQEVKAVCVLKRSELHFATFCIKSPSKFQGHFIHVPTRHNLNDMEGFADLYSLNEAFNITIKGEHEDKLIGIYQRRMKRRLQEDSSESVKPVVKKARKRDESENSEAPEEQEIKDEIKAEDPGWEQDFNPWGTGPLTATSNETTKDTMEVDENQAESSKKTKIKTHLSKKEKKELDKLEELAIKRAEQRVIEGEDLPPESVDEFDRLVLASPDSSLCWIQYIAYHLERKELDKAREVVQKALGKINFREENERFNVYMAWLNLETTFGSEEDSDKVLKEALKCNDEFKVYEKVGKMYMDGEKWAKAEKVYKILARKFNKELDVWVSLGLFYFKTGNLKEARFTLQRSLQNLKKSGEIVNVTSKYAQFEFLHGEAERGKTIFENIVRDFPGRTDQWCVYVDMVIKNGELETAREIFERMIHLGLTPKKMKSLFKKYWEFEQKQGDETKADAVRKKALEYLEKQNININDDEDAIEQMDTC